MATNVSFGQLVDPDAAAQQLQIQRQQQLVDMLRQQSLTPTPTETAGGMAVRQSPFLGLAKIASAYLSGKKQDELDEKSLGLSRDMAARYAKILSGDTSVDPTVASQVALTQGAAKGSVGPTMDNAQRMNTLTTPTTGGQPGGGSFSMANLLRGGVISQLGGDAAGGAFWDQFKLPEGVKTADMYGVPRSEMADALRRKSAAEGQTMVREGSTIAQTNADGSITPKFTAPDLKQGANLTWNGGIPTASPIQNLSEINADMAGKQAGAVERAKSENEMVTVNTPQGPKMMTRAQAVQLAGGGAPAAGGAPIAPPGSPPVQPAPQVPGSPPMDRSTFNNNPQVRQMASAQPDGAMVLKTEFGGDPAKVQAEIQQITQAIGQAKNNPTVQGILQGRLNTLNAAAQAAGSPAAPASGQPSGGVGIPLQDESSTAFDKTMGTNQANVLDDGYKKAKIAADDLLGIDQSRKALQRGVFVGSGAETKLAIAKFLNGNVPGISISPEKVGDTDYLKSTLGKGLLEQAKTLGSNPSNADATRINDIVGSIGKDPQALAKILDWRQQMSERAIQMHNTNVGQAVKNGFQPRFDMTVKNPLASATDIDALLRKYGGK